MCFVKGEKINEAIFFSFQRNRRALSMAQSVKPSLSCQVYNAEESHLVCFWWSISPKGYQTGALISFWGSHVPDADSCFGILHLPCDYENYSSFKRAMNSCINCQFVGYGRGWIREQMLENLNVNFCWVQRVFPYKSVEEIGFYSRPLMTY